VAVPRALGESLEKFRVHVGTTFFTIVVVLFHSIFTSDAHALAVLPDIARFTLDEEFACTFVIITCVATHTTRDALFLFLDVGFCVEVEDDVGLFSFCDDGIYGEIKDGLFLFFTLPFCAPVAILERGDTVSCAVGGGLVGVVWRIIEVLLFCSFSGRGGGRGAVGRYETGGRL
jgi:hypothetical protein